MWTWRPSTPLRLDSKPDLGAFSRVHAHPSSPRPLRVLRSTPSVLLRARRPKMKYMLLNVVI